MAALVYMRIAIEITASGKKIPVTTTRVVAWCGSSGLGVTSFGGAAAYKTPWYIDMAMVVGVA